MVKKMKNLLIVLSLLTGFVATQTVYAKATEQVQKTSQSVTLDVQNMTCAMCPITVKKALKNVNGVHSAEVDFGGKTANVTFNPQKTNIEALIQATTNLGYPSSVNLGK
jgi:mercuric ion binding protein